MKFWLHGAVLAGALGFLIPGVAWAGVPGPTPVPEPATLAVLAAGAGALAWVKFRGRK